jgi:uncharacterized peroxidase-related enzyme
LTYLNNPPFDEKDWSVFTAIREQFGFLPNFFPAQRPRPDMIDAEKVLTENLLMKNGALTRQQREYIFLVCSAANLSTYCVTAHCEIIRMLGVDGPEPEQIAIDHSHAKIPMTDKVLLNFCAKLNNHGPKITSRDVEILRTYGFSEQQILEAVLIVGWAKFANTVAFGLGTVPDFQNRRVAEELAKARAGQQQEPAAAVGKF